MPEFLKILPLPTTDSSKNVQPVPPDNEATSSDDISVDLSVTRSSLTELKQKLIYTVQSIFVKPQYFLVFALARFSTFRQIYAFISSLYQTVNQTCDRTTDNYASSLFTDLNTAEVGNILKSDGVCSGLKLPQPFLSELLHNLGEQNCYAGGKSDLGFKISQKHLVDRAFDKPFYVARYFNISSTCPQIIRLANDPKLQKIAQGYIGQQAKYTGSSLFWTFPVEGVSHDTDQQKFRYFHYDIDDFAGLRFCFYLTNVSLEDGPHICIRGSHTKKSVFHVFNYLSRIQTKEDLAKLYEPEKFLTIIGDSGTGFMEDTFCFHKGQPPISKPRLFLQLHFAANNHNQEQYLDSRDPDTLKTFPLTPLALS